jgi:phage tail sheath gpL-like
MVTKYANYDIASDATKVAPGVPTVQPKTYKLELIGLARENEGTLVQNVDDFAAKLVVEVDANNPGQMNSLQNPDFVDQLFVHAARVQFTA